MYSGVELVNYFWTQAGHTSLRMLSESIVCVSYPLLGDGFSPTISAYRSGIVIRQLVSVCYFGVQLVECL